MSFNFNTKSWISYHTYLPNFYVGDNNFFYSGLNEGCDVEAIAVTIIPTPSTTTTTTISTSASASATTTTPIKDVFIEIYSGASIAVFGNTKSFKEQLKKLGGRYNPHLTWQGKKQPGWIFPTKTRRALEQLFGMEASDKMKQEAQRVRETIKRFLKSKIRTNLGIQ